MVPSLTPMLRRNAKALRWAIVGGMSITFNRIPCLGMVNIRHCPCRRTHGLAEALASGEPATHYMKQHVGAGFFFLVAEYLPFSLLSPRFWALL